MGTPDFAVPTLKNLIENYQVIAVFTAPDRPAGRGMEIKKSPIKVLAEANNIDLYQPDKIKKSEWVEKITELKPDLIVVAAYGQIISQAILDIPKYGCINVHASLLPKYRGASPIHYALLNGDRETGITIMKMDAGMDTGDILSKITVEINPLDNLPTLHDKLAQAGAVLLIKTLPQYLSGELKTVPQDNDLATYTKILKKTDGIIDWNSSTDDILNKIRAFYPWPGTITNWDKQMLKIIAADKGEISIPAGEVKIIDGELLIGTKDQTIRVARLQLAGKKPVTAHDFIQGYGSINGAVLH